jgi:hypothetical protein
MSFLSPRPCPLFPPYPSNPLPASSKPSTHQINSRMLRDHRTISVSRLPMSSPPYLMVRNHCCRRLFHLPITVLPSSFTTIGSPQALRSLLHANAHQAFLYAISRFDPSEPTVTKAAFARALRAIAAACAELVGPSQWGLRDDSSPVREEAKLVLDYFFQVIALRHPAFRSLRLTNNSVARSSRCVPPTPHGYLDAGWHIYRAAPCCGTSRTESSYFCCGMDPSGRTRTGSFSGPAPLGKARSYSACALRWWWVGRASSHDTATQP